MLEHTTLVWKLSSLFWCVDEINQGLHERRERLVFKRIVANSTILPINPKLQPNLDGVKKDNMAIMTIFVFSGPNDFFTFLTECRLVH